MMHTRRQLGIQLLGMSALLAGRTAPAFAAEQVLRFGSISVAGNPTYTQTLEPFSRAIERESGGRLEVALKPAGGYGKPTELVPMVEKGEIEMATVLQGYYPGRFPESSVIELPLMFENSFVGTRALEALYREGLLAKDYATLKVIALYVAPPYALFTTGKKVTSLKDLRGLRIRVSGPTVGLALARLGAIPLGMPITAMGDAIASGAIDGLVFTMDSTLGTKGAGDKYLYEQLSVAIDLRLAGPAQIVAMHPATWNALPADLQAVIEKCAATFVADGVRYREESEVQAVKRLQADPRYTFVPFSAALYDDMRRAMVPVYDDWKSDMVRRGFDGERLLSRTRELVQQFSVAAR